MKTKVGVCIVGSNGAVATTVMAGVALMKRGMAPRLGMITEGPLKQLLDLAPLESLVFGGWDLRQDSAYDAAVCHKVLPRHLLDQVKDELSQVRPWPATASARYLQSMAGKHLVIAKNVREEIALLEQHILAFKAEHGFERMAMVNLASTERYSEVQDVHRSIGAFEAGLDRSDASISPAMKYAYLACKMGIPHVNFTPSLTLVPALEELACQHGVPLAGEDGKTGQTLLKTALAPAFAIRQLHVDGWFSTNILGNNDGLVLNDPESSKTKIASKRKVLDGILGYPVEDHQVHIHYYKPRGDSKESWDNIDVSGFLGERMQIKVDFLCKDSILAAPLVLDLVRLLDCAKRTGERGIQRQMSFFFKAPYHAEGEQPIHDLFKQHDMLMQWAERVAQEIAKRDGNGQHRTIDLRGNVTAQAPSVLT